MKHHIKRGHMLVLVINLHNLVTVGNFQDLQTSEIFYVHLKANMCSQVAWRHCTLFTKTACGNSRNKQDPGGPCVPSWTV